MYIMLGTEKYNDRIFMAIITLMVFSWVLQTSREGTIQSVRRRKGKEKDFIVLQHSWQEKEERERERERNYQSFRVPELRNNPNYNKLYFDLGFIISRVSLVDACMYILYVCMHAWVFSCFSHVWAQAPLSMRFSRKEYWHGLPQLPPGDLPDPGIEPTFTAFPEWQADSLPLNHWFALTLCIIHIISS